MQDQTTFRLEISTLGDEPGLPGPVALRQALIDGLTAAGYINLADVEVAAESERTDDGPSDRQALAVADLMRRFGAPAASLTTGTGGLPGDWLEVVLRPARGPDFHAGIDPQGSISS